MGPASRARAFTLIEAMMVVTLVGILAVLATVAYRRWTHTAYLAEAQDMVANIRAAEESFRAENGGYLTISSQLGPGFDDPAKTPGQMKTAWGGVCDWCTNDWKGLSVAPSAPVAFGYSLIAANSSTTSGGAPVVAPALTVNGNSMHTDQMTPPWYIIEADGDTDGNQVYAHVYGLSATNMIFTENEGE